MQTKIRKEISKFYLEKMLIELERMNQYGEKTKVLNGLLNEVIIKEKKTGKYYEQIPLTDFDYNILFQ